MSPDFFGFIHLTEVFVSLSYCPQVPTGGKLHFEASGTGVGVMHVDVRFNVPHDDQVCRFELFIVSRQLSSMLQQFFWQQRQ